MKNVIIGRKPVLEAINSNEPIEAVYVQYGQQGNIIESIRITAKKRGIKFSILSPDKFKAITSNPNSQGTAAVKSFRKYFSIEEIINSSKQKEYPLLLLLDSIQDPHNLGAILRTAECAGVDGVIITKHNSASITETVVKTSAGASELLKIVPVNNLINVIEELKDNGYWIAGTSLQNSVEYDKVDYKLPLAVIMGNEEKGIRRLTAEKCDILIKIPMIGKIDSLNVSVSTGIILFEVNRQRKNESGNSN